MGTHPLRAVRKQRGVSQEWLADQVGVSMRTIRRIELNQHDTAFSVMGRIATALGVSLDDLYIHEPVSTTDGNGRGRNGTKTHESPTAESPQIQQAAGLR